MTAPHDAVDTGQVAYDVLAGGMRLRAQEAGETRRAKRRAFAARLVIGQWWERRADHAVFQVRNVYRTDRRVQLAPDFGGQPMSVTFDELRRDYRQVSER